MPEHRPAELIKELRGKAPHLASQVESLAANWLAPVLERLDLIAKDLAPPPKRKQINDPVWHIINLEPQEIFLLDSPLLQRMRGVRQLGLAHFVFPGATHDRFAHICGVIEAAARMYDALSGNERVRQRQQAGGNTTDSAILGDDERWIVRMAALLHDVGHGPFSHAVEPVVTRTYATEIVAFNALARDRYNLDKELGVAEIISVLIVTSNIIARVFAHGSFPKPQSFVYSDLQLRIAILIMGGRHPNYNAALSAIISGQVDADKLDYMARDAMHSGMPIAFDTERLLGKLEIIRCTPTNLPRPRTKEDKRKIEFARSCPKQQYLEIGIVPSGVGALEQMLVGRAFLYDRLYYHHKVRSADAMAQRLLLYSLGKSRALNLSELYLDFDDDTLIRLFGGIVQIKGREQPQPGARDLAHDILSRQLYHRAVAFRARFHHAESEISDQQ